MSNMSTRANRSRPATNSAHLRVLGHLLEVAREVEREDDVVRAVADDLVRDVDVARADVLRAGQCHARYRLPRRACSRSIASKSDLKLPIPKPREPWRSMTSKKSVGRSWTIFVKSCSR